jgi:hypothetical protein
MPCTTTGTTSSPGEKSLPSGLTGDEGTFFFFGPTVPPPSAPAHTPIKSLCQTPFFSSGNLFFAP